MKNTFPKFRMMNKIDSGLFAPIKNVLDETDFSNSWNLGKSHRVLSTLHMSGSLFHNNEHKMLFLNYLKYAVN